MKLSFRKSFNVGGVRLNLSKRGIGSSVGIKGLRIGVNSLGKSYISGNIGGLHYTSYAIKNFNNNTNYNSLNNTSNIKNNFENQLDNIDFPKTTMSLILPLIMILFLIIGIFQPIFLIFCVLLAVYIIIINLYFIITRNSAIKYTDLLVDSIKYKKYNEFKNIIEKIDGKMSLQKFKEIILLKSYSKILSLILEDNIIDENEKEIINILLSKMDSEKINELHEFYLSNFVSLFIEDKIITEDENKFINDFIKLFNIPKNISENYLKIINNYIMLRQIEEQQLKFIQPSINILEYDKCYYEVEFIYVKLKKQRNNYSYVYETSGKLFLTQNLLQLISDNNKSFKFKDIIKYELIDNEIIEIIVKNRKTSILLTTKEIEKTFVYLKKVINLINKE